MLSLAPGNLPPLYWLYVNLDRAATVAGVPRNPPEDRRLQLECRVVGRRVLPVGDALRRLFGALRLPLRHRRDRRDVLPDAYRTDGGRLAGQDPARFPLRGQGAAGHHAREDSGEL